MNDQEIRGKIIQILHDRRKLAEGNWVRLNELDFSGGEPVTANSIAEALRYLAYYVEWEAPASLSGINLGRARLRNAGTDLAEGNYPPPPSIIMPVSKVVNLEARSQSVSSGRAAPLGVQANAAVGGVAPPPPPPLGVEAKARAAGEVDLPPFVQNDDSASQIAIDNFRRRDGVARTETFGPVGSGPIGAEPIAGGPGPIPPRPTISTEIFNEELRRNLSNGFIIFSRGLRENPDLARAEITRRVETIRRLYEDAPRIFPDRGHNNPPELLEIVGAPELLGVLDEIRNAVAHPSPANQPRRDWHERLDKIANRIGSYTANLLDVGAQEAAKKAGATLAVAGLTAMGITAAGICAISFYDDLARQIYELAYLVAPWGALMF